MRRFQIVVMIRDKRRLFAQGFVPRLAVSLSTKAEAEMKLLYLDAQPMDPRYLIGESSLDLSWP